MSRTMLSATVFAMAALMAVPAVQAEEDPIQLLQVTGGGWHDYEEQQHILSEGITERLDVEVDTFYYDGEVEALEIEFFEDPAWIEGYDVVMYNKCWAANVEGGEGWVVEHIITPHVENDIPAVFVHGTLHSYRFHDDAEEWHRFIGVSSFEHQEHVPFTVEHARRGDFLEVGPDHPIIADMPLPWETPHGELYWIVDVFEDTTPLAHAEGTDEEYHPVIWINRYEGLRNFGTSIGHHNETMEHPVFLDMLSRGILWSVGREDEAIQEVEVEEIEVDAGLEGEIIGTEGSWAGEGNTKENVFDGNFNTFFDAPDGYGDDAWVGLDLGEAEVIGAVSYAPREDFADRMVGGRFEGADNADFSGAEELYTITSEPPEGEITTANVDNDTAFQYVRYVTPEEGFCNASVIQFHAAE